MTFNQATGIQTQPVTPMAPAGEEKEMISFEQKKEMRELILSLSGKLNELAQINERLFRRFDSSVQTKFVTDHLNSDVPSLDSSTQDMLGDPVLDYRLSSLMDFLKQTFGFHHWGVFLITENNSHPHGSNLDLKKLVSSLQFTEDEFSEDFEKEVKAQWKSGHLVPAVTQKRRIIVPAEEGELLIVPFNILSNKDALWVAQFKKSVPSEINTSGDLLFWVGLVSACIENSYLNKSLLSLTEGKSSSVAGEKLFTVVQLSRGMVHEINNYLQIILGRIQIARMNQNKSPESTSSTHILETIEGNANRICASLKNFSDFLHRQRDGAVGTQEVNLQHILESNLDLVRYLLKSSGIELEQKVDDDLPSVWGEPGELELACLSLIWGIGDCLTTGGSIRLHASKEKEELCLSAYVAEKKSEKDKYFDSVEVHNNHRLHLASQILAKHHGVLEVEELIDGEKKLVLRFPIAENKVQNIRRTV